MNRSKASRWASFLRDCGANAQCKNLIHEGEIHYFVIIYNFQPQALQIFQDFLVGSETIHNVSIIPDSHKEGLTRTLIVDRNSPIIKHGVFM